MYKRAKYCISAKTNSDITWIYEWSV